MTKMAATPIYNKTLKILSNRSYIHMIKKFVMELYEPNLYTFYINYDTELTLTYFTAISNFAQLVSVLIFQVSVYSTIGPLVWIFG